MTKTRRAFVALVAAAGATAVLLGCGPPGAVGPRAGAAREGDNCPTPTGDGVVRPFVEAPMPHAQNMTTQVSTTGPDGSVVDVYAGASGNDPLAGVVLVWTLPADPCVSGNPGGVRQEYYDPAHSGPLTITAVSGTTVQFTAPGNRVGTVDYQSGVFH